jgi:hypothetical protein
MKKIKFYLIEGSGISFLNRISQAFFVLILLFNTNYLNAQNWCKDDATTQCSNCRDTILSGVISHDYSRPRVLYVDKLVTFVCDDSTKQGCSSEDWYKINPKLTILGISQNEHKLFQYAVDAGFDNLILYNITNLLRRGFDKEYNDDANRLYPPQELERFITIAKQMYGLDVSIVAPEAQGNSPLASMFNNINEFYDLQSFGSMVNNYGTLVLCDSSWQRIWDGGSVNGGYFRIGDIPTYYEIDDSDPNNLRYHPFDHAVVDLANVMYNKYRSTVSFDQWWADIWDLIRVENEGVLRPDGCFNEYIPFQGFDGPEKCFEQLICYSYSRIVTEYEFWINELDSIEKNYGKEISDSANIIFDIENSYKQYKELLEMAHCLKEQLELEMYEQVPIVISDDPDEPVDPDAPIEEYPIVPVVSTSCPFFIDTYLMQLTSSNYNYNGTKMSSKSYVFGSTWEIDTVLYHTVESYNYDSINQQIANEIDGLVDRIYLATYNQTPCHLWSDDMVTNSVSSYRRRFKDVYAYFSGNNIGKFAGNKTEIFPLFSARHDSIVDTTDVFKIDIILNKKREHLGLFLTALDSVFGGPPSSSSLGRVENAFHYFGNRKEFRHMSKGCNFTNETSPRGNLNVTVIAPTGFQSDSIGDTNSVEIWGGSYFELSNVVEGENYEIISKNHPADYLTVRYHSSSGIVVQTGLGSGMRFTAPKSGSYFVHVARNGGSDCNVNTSPPTPNRKEIKISHIPKTFYSFSDPIIDTLDFYDNVVNGYCWYRYSELSGRNTWSGTPIYKNNPNEQTNVSQNQFIESGLKIFPNPTVNGLINLSKDFKGSYYVYDLTGKLVQQGFVNSNTIHLNTTELSGVYILNLVSETETHSVKLLISKS